MGCASKQEGPGAIVEITGSLGFLPSDTSEHGDACPLVGSVRVHASTVYSYTLMSCERRIQLPLLYPVVGHQFWAGRVKFRLEITGEHPRILTRRSLTDPVIDGAF
jgi:hypothetical protein